MMQRRTVLAGVFGLAVSGMSAAAITMTGRARAAETNAWFTRGGHAIGGYDPVAYHKENRPVKGDETLALEWRGATWLFASASNRAAFEAEPEKFAPRYGGYCAYAVANGYTAKTDPDAFSLVDGKLYLNYSRRVRRMWDRDVPGNISAADGNWPGLRPQQ